MPVIRMHIRRMGNPVVEVERYIPHPDMNQHIRSQEQRGRRNMKSV